MKALRLVADPTARVQMSEEEAIAERAKAEADMQAAKRQMTLAATAGLNADPAAERMTRDALAAQQAARKRIADADDTLVAIREAKAEAEREQAAKVLEARWKQTADLCRLREKAAERVQRAALEMGRGFAEMHKLQGEILGVLPGVRTSRTAGDWYDGTRSALGGQVCIAAEGMLNQDSMGHYTLGEFRGVAIDVPSKVRMQHRQILVRAGGKPLLTSTESPDGNEPSAA